MELKIVDVKEEPLLSRKLVRASIEFEKATPNYAEVASSLSSSLKTDEKLIALKHVYNLFGSKKAEVIAHVYSDENKKNFIESQGGNSDIANAIQRVCVLHLQKISLEARFLVGHYFL